MEIVRSSPKIMLCGHTSKAISNAVSVCYDLPEDPYRSARVIDKGHLSVLRHGFASVHISGISRACGRQLLRKSHADYVEMSQRYCNMDNPRFIIAHELYDKLSDDTFGLESLKEYLQGCMNEYRRVRSMGMTKQSARYLIPQCVETKMVMSGNLQMWWDFFNLRINKRVEQECRQVAEETFRVIYSTFPDIFCKHPKLKEVMNGKV